jgi:hypothetical protein
MLPRHAKAAPGSEYVGREVARMTTLDSLSDELIRSDDRVAVKLDVQGYEAEVIKGADRTLTRTKLVEAELSLVPLYEGQSTICEIVELLQANGFDLVLLERNFREMGTGFTLQVDGIFVRADV